MEARITGMWCQSCRKRRAWGLSSLSVLLPCLLPVPRAGSQTEEELSTGLLNE